MRKIALFTLAGALALSACGKKHDTESTTNNLVEPPVENVIVNEPDAAPPPPPVENSVSDPAPAPTISEQQQIQDDAEATGMTTRLRQASDDGAAGSDEAVNSGG